MFSKAQNSQNKIKFKNRSSSILLLFLIIMMFSSILFISKCNKNDQPTKPIPIIFNSEDSKIQGIFYPANINKPAPTVILLHGSPGGDKDVLGLGTKMMKEGINAARVLVLLKILYKM